MIVVNAILEVGETSDETREAYILLAEDSEGLEMARTEDETALADYISDETGYCVQEIIGYKEVDYII